MSISLVLPSCHYRAPCPNVHRIKLLRRDLHQGLRLIQRKAFHCLHVRNHLHCFDCYLGCLLLRFHLQERYLLHWTGVPGVNLSRRWSRIFCSGSIGNLSRSSSLCFLWPLGVWFCYSSASCFEWCYLEQLNQSQLRVVVSTAKSILAVPLLGWTSFFSGAGTQVSITRDLNHQTPR
jgi:hypothetical protein